MALCRGAASNWIDPISTRCVPVSSMLKTGKNCPCQWRCELSAETKSKHSQSSGCGKQLERDFSRKDHGAGSAGWCGGSRGPQRTHCVRLRSPPLLWPWCAESGWRLRTPRSNLRGGRRDERQSPFDDGSTRMKEARILILGVHGPRYKLGLLIGEVDTGVGSLP